jgi:hypothetical protein
MSKLLPRSYNIVDLEDLKESRGKLDQWFKEQREAERRKAKKPARSDPASARGYNTRGRIGYKIGYSDQKGPLSAGLSTST